MISQGFYEACTYSFESPKQLDKLCLPSGHPLRQTVQIQNPLGEDYSVMRTSMLPSLLQVAATNWNRSVDSARVFEIAYVYRPKALPLTELPEEIRHLTAFIYEAEQHLKDRVFFTLKGTVDELFLHLGLSDLQYLALTECPWLHPGLAAEILLNGQVIGQIGVIHPDVADLFAAAPQTVILDLELATIIDRATEIRQYKPLPRFPAVTRDLALLAEAAVSADRLTQVIRQAAGEHLEQIKLFDVYQGPQVPTGMKSIAFNLVFRSAERTLSDEDIQPAMQKILQQLKDRCQAILRE